jgi:branched-subunit amino acid aminotransferase/4-amino-4-deoxychorismate lyase
MVVEAADGVSVIVTVRPPASPQDGPLDVRSVPYQRPLAHLKQVGGGFGQTYYRKVAEREGFDEILLTGPDGVLVEGGITNVGCFDGSGVVWPSAPCLSGITMQLLEPRLGDAGLASRRATVRLADVGRYETVFVTNSHGVVPIARVDNVTVPVDAAFMKTLDEVYESVPWDRI